MRWRAAGRIAPYSGGWLDKAPQSDKSVPGEPSLVRGDMKMGLKYLVRATAWPVFFLLYFLSGLVKRRPDLWVFGSWSGMRFADNSAALFEYCNSRIADRVEIVWISRNAKVIAALRRQNYRAYRTWSPHGIICCLRAGVFVFDCTIKDVSFWLSRKAVLVNLWHGIPQKKIERDIDIRTSRYYQIFHGAAPVRLALGLLTPWHLKRADLYICTSALTQTIMRSAFGAEKDSVAITGLPRNDILFDNRLSAVVQDTPLAPLLRRKMSEARRVFTYLPTFRDSGLSYQDIDWNELEKFLGRENALFIYKLHPTAASNENSFDSEHVKCLDKKTDIYELLSLSDVLISDYSSVIYDFFLTKRPLIYYIPDIEEFERTSRTFYPDLVDLVAGPKASCFEDLLAAMKRVLDGHEDRGKALERRREVARRPHEHIDGGAAGRVLEEILVRAPGAFSD